MSKIFLSLILVCAGISVGATEIKGTIRLNHGKMWLEQRNGDLLRLSASSPFIIKSLRQLRGEDYLEVDGTLSREILKVEEVQFVGLKRLIGTWQKTDGSRLRVDNFSALTWYTANPDGNGYAKVEDIEYALAPDGANSWSILMVRDRQASTGRLVFVQNEIHLEIWVNGRPNRTEQFKRSGPL